MKDLIVNLIKNNLKNPKLYIGLFALLLVVLLLFPYIDANFFYYERVEKRVSILKDVTEININTLQSNPILKDEYDSILAEMEKQKNGSIGNILITTSSQQTKIMKFLSGAALMWFIAILCLFISFHRPFDRIAGIMLFSALGGAFGYLAEAIPTIIQPTVNYILMPVLQILLLAFLVTSSNTKKANDDAQ